MAFLQKLCNKIENRLKKFGEIINDNRIKTYYVTVNLINNESISFELTPEYFGKFSDWYNSTYKDSYMISSFNSMYRLSKENIIGVTFERITNLKYKMLPFLCVITAPISRIFSLVNYLKILLIAPITVVGYIGYEVLYHKADFYSVLHYDALEKIFISTINGISVLFIFIFISLFMWKLSNRTSLTENDTMLHQYKKQTKYGLNSAILNLVLIYFINRILIVLLS